MDNTSDTELIHLALNGDTDAFERLINTHYMSVYRIAYKWCGIKEDAEDIAQEVFVKLARKLETFKQKSSFSTWLYRITVNTAKDFIRKQTGHRALEHRYAEEHIRKNPGSNTEAHLEASRMCRALTRLPEKQKDAMLLVFGEGLSHKEAAKVLDCKETTISWRIFQARKNLHKALGRER